MLIVFLGISFVAILFSNYIIVAFAVARYSGRLNDIAIRLSDITVMMANKNEEVSKELEGVRVTGFEKLNERLGTIAAEISDLRLLQGRSSSVIDSKIERAWLSTDFIRTHFASYLGNGRALTYMRGDIPIFVNSDDKGGPAVLINGGEYEDDNLDLILSFVKPNTVFLDIGANVGFFTLNVAARLRHTSGKILSFEPHPEVYELLTRSVFHNAISDRVEAFPFGLANKDEVLLFTHEEGHVGGNRALPALQSQRRTDDVVGPGSAATSDPLKLSLQVRRLDDVLPTDFRCDLVKIDVEGGELGVLRGMENIIARSPEIKILFEKFSLEGEFNERLWEFLKTNGFLIFSIGVSARLEEILDVQSFASYCGYAFASKRVVENPTRSRFCIYPSQIFVPQTDKKSDLIKATAKSGDVLFYGPYWPLRLGRYRMVLHGNIAGKVLVSITERMGYFVAEAVMEAGRGELTVSRDLTNFECVARAFEGPASVDLHCIELIRL